MRRWARPWRRGRPRRWRWSSTASDEIELADLCGPRGATRGCVVFVHMPEVHPIGRINGCIGVIAPAPCWMGLGAAAIGHDCFALPKVIRGIASQPPGITNSGENAIARGGIANGRVAVLIDGY